MAMLMNSSSRYSSYDSRTSYSSDPSSSLEFKTNRNVINRSKKSPVLLPTASSRALVKSKPSDVSTTTAAKNPNFTNMVKKLMGKKNSAVPNGGSKAMELVIPVDVIAADIKKTARKQGLNGGGLGGLPRKLFGVDKDKSKKKEVKALTEVKGSGNGINARTLAMVLRSERELLSANKEQETEISGLKLMLEQKNKEIEKLKDLCLSQREEIKSLKSAILFPDVMNTQLQEQLEKQGSELKQAKQMIPTLQKQVSSLTGQLQCLAEDLAEVKQERHTGRACFQHRSSSPTTPMYDHEEASNSLDFESDDATAPGTPDDLFLEDLNPCLTPNYVMTKSKEREAMAYDSPHYDSYSYKKVHIPNGVDFTSHARKVSKSSDCYQNHTHNSESKMVRTGRLSDESKCTYGKLINHRHF